jgi:hypothetical protein
VIFPYVVDRARVPQIPLGGGVDRPRPVAAIRLFGPGGGTYIIDGRFDTASDDTVFPLWVSAMIGLDVSQAPEQEVHLVARPQPIRVRFAPVELRLSDGTETCQWPALVGFAPIPGRRALLGYTGCLQFFDSTFRGHDREAILVPNAGFAGQHF